MTGGYGGAQRHSDLRALSNFFAQNGRPPNESLWRPLNGLPTRAPTPPWLVNAFDRIFTSHELRLRKPEREAFDRICGLTGVLAESFLFFDDLPVNVQAARDAGFQAVLVRSPDDVAMALESLGLVRRGA